MYRSSAFLKRTFSRTVAVAATTVVGFGIYSTMHSQRNQNDCEAIPNSNPNPSSALDAQQHHKVLVLGGGTAGITVAAQLARKLPPTSIAIVEPSQTHYYQPLWTMVGGGLAKKTDSQRDTKDVIPNNTIWIQDRMASVQPESNQVLLASGKRISYDYLVVATGIHCDWDKIKGLAETLGENGVCSIYSYEHCQYVHELSKKLESGKAVFTLPNSVIKCGGAPQKIMYLTVDTLLQQKTRNNFQVVFNSAWATMFPVVKYGEALDKLRKELDIEANFKCDLIEVRGDKKEAVFKRLTDGSTFVESFDILHVVPPMSTSKELRASTLVNAAGFVEVDKETLQHVKFPNVFSLGDCSNLPTAKTAAAVSKEAPVLVANMLEVMNGGKPKAKYDGYTSCPITVGNNKLMLAEFKYNLVVQETFPWDQSKPNSFHFFLKKRIFPWAYWNHMLKGRWYGPDHFIPPAY